MDKDVVPVCRDTLVLTVCRRCLSHHAVLTLTRPATTWYFCPDCEAHWAAPIARSGKVPSGIQRLC